MPSTAPLSLDDWAALPLHRVTASAAISSTGNLSQVGGIEAKVAAAARLSRIRALGVCATQQWDGHSTTYPTGQPMGDRTEGGLSILKAASVGELARAIAGRLGDEVYGPVVPLPQVLTLADANKRFDYRASSFHPFEWLDSLVGDALRAPTTPAPAGPVAQEQSLGEVRKLMPKGYLHILGTAGSGKTSWALNWVRRSQGDGLAGALPRLAGWYFARRFGASGVGRDSEQDEISALQNLVSLARRQRDVLPTRPLLLNDSEASLYRSQRHLPRGPDSSEEALLRERFIEAIEELTAAHSRHGSPSAESPLVFLIDGGDEMWGASARHTRWTFPRILPTLEQLPDHVYIVLLSRPGAHMLGFRSREPLLRYQFAREHVDAAICGYLRQQASALQALYPGNEASPLLLDAKLQGHVARASGGGFGYAPLLMWQWHADRTLDAGVELQAQRLRQWLQHPGNLPDGVHGLRAREFLDMQEKVEDEDPRVKGLAWALALLTQLRGPLTQRDLLELLYPEDAAAPHDRRGPAAQRFYLLVRQGAGWLSGVQQADAPLQFGHQSLAEVAQAAWRLSAHNLPLTERALVAEARALAVANTGEDPPQRAATTVTAKVNTSDAPLTEQLRQQADAWLHADLAGSIEMPAYPPRWPAQQALQPSMPWLKQGESAQTAWAYDLMWGPLHALTAAASLPPIPPAEPSRRLGTLARRLLIDAPYLQAAIRAQAQHAKQHGASVDAQALREAYTMADRLPGEDADRVLRHRVESAVLEWYQHIASGAAQVGGVLWNLLGADELGQAHAKAWKASMDEPALITERPGTSPAFARMIPAKLSAVTECGDWLVTSDGQTYTEVWDLRDGWHRAVVHTKVDWAVGDKLCVCTDGVLIGVGGQAIGEDHLLVLGWIHLSGGRSHVATYAGQRGTLDSIALCASLDSQGRVAQWALASGSRDATVALLLRSPQQVLQDAQRSAADPQWPNPGLLARYAGHRGFVNAVAVRAAITPKGEVTHWVLASASQDATVGLLLRSPQQVPQDAERFCAERKSSNLGIFGRRSGDLFSDDPEPPNPGLLARYAGHRSGVSSVALRAATDAQGHVTQWAVASGSLDKTVSLLLRSPQLVLQDAEQSLKDQAFPNPGVLARYSGHSNRLESVALCAATTPQGQVTHWAVASGSADYKVGLLLRSPDQVRQDAEQSARWERPNPAQLALYAGHGSSPSPITRSAVSVALRAASTPLGEVTHWALASGSADGTVGLLLRSPQQVPHDAARSSADQESPNPGLLARYAGHRGQVSSIALRAVTTPQGQVTHWALASGSEDGTARLLLRSAQQMPQDAERSSEDQKSPNPGLLARYAGHYHGVRSVALRAATTSQGSVTLWALATGGRDRRVGLLLRSHQQVLQDAARSGEDPQSPNRRTLARYVGHSKKVTSIALHAATTTEGQVTYWAVASGDEFGTVGLLVRSPQQVLHDAERSAASPELPNPGMLALYAGHRGRVRSVDLRAATTPQGQVTHWALASGSDDATVGLLLRSPEQVLHDAGRPRADSARKRKLARYAGHRDSVNSVAVRAATTSKGQVTHWAVASGSTDTTVGLILCSPEQVRRDAWRSEVEEKSPNPGALARYSGHRHGVRAIALRAAITSQGLVTHWALASGSSDTVGLLVRSPQQVLQDAERSAASPESPNLRMLTCDARHRDSVDAVALRASTTPQGQVTHWSLASGFKDYTVGVWTTPHVDLLEQHPGDALTQKGHCVRIETGRPEFVHVTTAAPPRRHSVASPSADEPLYWLGGDSGVVYIWQSMPHTDLQVQFVCPYYVEGFEAMAFAQAPNRMHYMVGGSVGWDVALLALRVFDPTSPESV